MDNLPTAQVEIITPCVLPEGAFRTTRAIWVSEKRARELIDMKVARAVAGPAETKPAEPSEKKSSAAAPAGRSTDFQKSSVHGTDAPSAASPAGPASPPRRRRARKPGSTPPDAPSGSLP